MNSTEADGQQHADAQPGRLPVSVQTLAQGDAMPVTVRPPETRTVDRTIVRNVHAPFVARRFARTMTIAWGLREYSEPVELVTSELVSNAVQHGAGISIDVRLICRDDTVTVKIWDADSTRYPIMAAADALEENGRGLLLVDALALKWGSYQAVPAGKVVWAAIGRCPIPPGLALADDDAL